MGPFFFAWGAFSTTVRGIFEDNTIGPTYLLPIIFIYPFSPTVIHFGPLHVALDTIDAPNVQICRTLGPPTLGAHLFYTSRKLLWSKCVFMQGHHTVPTLNFLSFHTPLQPGKQPKRKDKTFECSTFKHDYLC